MTPTGTWTTNTTYTGQYRRCGDTGEFIVNVALSGAPDAVALVLTVPAGLTIDTSKLVITALAQVGYASLSDTGTAVYSGPIMCASSTTLTVFCGQTDLVTGYLKTNTVTPTTPYTFANTDFIYCRFSLPISGW